MDMIHSRGRRRFLAVAAASVAASAIDTRYAFAAEDTPNMKTTSNYLPVRPEWLASGTEAAIEPEMPIIDAHHHFYERPGWI